MKNNFNNQQLVTYSVLDTDKAIMQAISKTNTDFINNASNLLVNGLSSVKNEIVDSFILNEEKKFHDNLNFFQKYVPFVSKDNTTFIKKTRFKANLMNIGFSAGVEALNIFFQHDIYGKLVNKYYNNPLLFKTLIFDLLYVNEKNWSAEEIGISLNAKLKLLGIMDRHNISKSDYKLNKWINNRASTTNLIPLPKNYRKDMNIVGLYLRMLFKLCDADDLTNFDSDVYIRLKEISTNYYGLKDDEFNIILANSLNENILQSSILEVAQFSIMDFLGDLIQNVQGSQERINTLVELDPYRIKRESIKRNVLKAGGLIAAGGLTYLTGGVGDFIIATTAPLLLKSFDDATNPALKKEINNRFNDVMFERREKFKIKNLEQRKINEKV